MNRRSIVFNRKNGEVCDNKCKNNYVIVKSASLPATVSIIIPTYNRWELLSDALESIFSQTYTEWEAVVVNDGGRQPEEKMRQILNHPRVTYVEHNDNKGLAFSRNTGIDCGKGVFIAYLDDDDIYYPNHLEVLLKTMLENKWDVAYTDAYKGIYRKENGRYLLVKKILEYSSDYNINNLWLSNHIPVNCMMHRRDCFEKTGKYDSCLKVLEDWDLWLRMSLYYDFQHLPIITAEYRVRDDKSNMTLNTTLKTWIQVKYGIYVKYMYHQKLIKNQALKQQISKSMYGSIKEHIKANSYNKIWKTIDDNDMNYLRLMTIKYIIKLVIKKPYYIIAILLKEVMNTKYLLQTEKRT